MIDFLQQAGHQVSHVTSAEEGMAALDRELLDVVLLDLSLPGMGGLEFLRGMGNDGPPVIVVSSNADVGSVVAAMRAGAADYVSKPLTFKTLAHLLDRVVEMARLRRQVDRLEREVIGDPDPARTTYAPAMRRCLDMAQRFARNGESAPVLLVGESGAGKEVIAAYLHRNSSRARGPFVRINVAAIPDTMMEAELFGATRGAFTDARRDRQGFFSAAQGGTLLLDEIAEMRIDLQTKLLRAIETKRFYPVGATREVAADVRIIAATNKDPNLAIESGQLRKDLYFRLATMVLHLPPLRERTEDIAPIARSVLSGLRRQTRRGPRDFSPEAIAAMEAYPWPGNVRELRNAIERMAILCDGDIITPDDLEVCGIFAWVGMNTVSKTSTSSGEWPVAPSGHTGGYPAIRPRTPTGAAPSLGSLNAQAPQGATPTLGASAAQTPQAPSPAPLPPSGASEALDVVVRRAAELAERQAILTALAQTGNNRTRAADALGISRSTLWQKMQRYGISDS
ncbi:MAG: sigma-54-dependent Fis family transcriptional regulator [Myxococcales bacterium]|nr:sigma-54-dependent Fis family transcriptional regulator [Myxococcales bacterium]